MDSVESLDVSSIDDLVTISDAIKTVEERADIQESVGLSEEDDKRKKRKHEKLSAVVTSPQMIMYYKKKEDTKNEKAAEKEKRKIERERRKMEKEQKKVNYTKRNRKSSSESSISFDDSIVNELCDLDYGESEEEGLPIFDESELKEGQFVLVSMMGGKRNAQKYVYLCIIQDIRDKAIHVQRLKSTKNKNEFVIVENDLFNIKYQDLISIMPQPELKMKDRQLTYTFNKKLAVREKM
ncbi:hypothetical protein AVEN_94219-1 [Araneus ventricosus]|uniref:Uncharacterized protein n=1 Tax=Araneus ventricosus TaxID=182803 RepID=A0A4Y2QC89_ARAVE|nr:hypothetical protein AVEN_94219-1 [Araneus ventricosus]